MCIRDSFERGARKNVAYICFTEYDATIPNKEVAFKKVELKNTFGEYLAAHGKKQARIAETEKYAHVTFFFNGGVEEPNEGEDRILDVYKRQEGRYNNRCNWLLSTVTSDT